MRASWALLLSSLCVGIHAFGPPPVGDAAQHVLGSRNVSGQSYTCNNGAVPSPECVPQSSESNCDCTCSNGIRFNQPLSLASTSNPILDSCQSEREGCLLREQQLANDFEQLKASYMLKEQQYLEMERDLQRQVAICQGNAWTYEGCYTDSANRALTGLWTEASDMTAEKCAATCAQYKYYGLEFYKHCFCGDSFVGPTNKALDTNCNTKCTGSNEMCGGAWHLSLYSKKTV